MNIINRLLGPICYGFAISRFMSKRYDKALKLFETAYRLYPNPDSPEYYYSCLGRCYLSLGKYKEALDALGKAYELYKNRGIEKIEEQSSKEEYEDFLHAYTTALAHFGEKNEAIKIAKERKKLPWKIEQKN